MATLGDVAELCWLQVEGLSEVNYCFQAPWPPIDSSINTNGKHASVRPFPLGVFIGEDISGCTEGSHFSLPSLPVLWELEKFWITAVKCVNVWKFFMVKIVRYSAWKEVFVNPETHKDLTWLFLDPHNCKY